MEIRTDAGYVDQQLNAFMPEVVMEAYPDRTYSRAFPLATGLSPGMTSVTYMFGKGVGAARIVEPTSREVPLVEFDVQPFTAGLRLIRLGFEYSQEDIRQAQFAGGAGLDRNKALVTMEGMEEKIDRTAWVGDSPRQLYGLANHPNILRIVTSTTFDANSTPTNILAAMNLAVAKGNALTNSVETPDAIALPPEEHKYIHQTPYSVSGAGDVRTIAEVFLAGNPEIKEILKVHWLSSGSGAVSSNTMMVFNRSRAKVEHLLAMVPTRLPVAWDGTVYRVVMEAKSGGLRIHKPFSVLALEGI